MLLFAVMAAWMSFGVGYVVVRNRRHPDKNVPKEYMRMIVGLPLLACVFWIMW